MHSDRGYRPQHFVNTVFRWPDVITLTDVSFFNIKLKYNRANQTRGRTDLQVLCYTYAGKPPGIQGPKIQSK